MVTGHLDVTKLSVGKHNEQFNYVAVHLTPPIALRRPSHAIFPILHCLETSSWRPCVMHVSVMPELLSVSANWYSEHDLKLTFLSATDTYIHTHIPRIDFSFRTSANAFSNKGGAYTCCVDAHLLSMHDPTQKLRNGIFVFYLHGTDRMLLKVSKYD